MKKYILPIILLLLFLNTTKAQQITLVNTLNNVCRENLIEIPFSLSGVFDSGNTFTVQIKPYSSSIWTNLETVGNTSPLKFTIPNSFNRSEYSYGSYQIRIISSKPIIVSNDIYFSSLLEKPLITLSGALESIINPHEPARLLLNGSGAMPVKVVLDDSTTINASYFNTYTGVPIYPTESKEYKIAYAENVCGRGVVSGNAKITVNEIGLTSLLSSDEKICTGGKFKLSYSANGKFNENNNFKIVFRNFYVSTSKEYEVDAIEKDGVLEMVIPNNIPTGIKYQVRIVSSSPKAVSNWSGEEFSILVGSAPSAEITNSNTKVNFGDWMFLNFDLTGVSPWHITLSDGTVIDYDLSSYSENSYSVYKNIIPQESKDIRISSVLTGCGFGTSSSKTVNIEVLNRPNIIINTPKDKIELCVGESIEMTYSTFGDWGNDESLSAFLSNGTNEYYTKITVPATFKDGKVKFTIPNDLLTKISAKYFTLGIISKKGKIAYSSFFSIHSIPQVSFYNETYNIAIPGSDEVKLPMLIRGAGNTIVTLDDSTTYTFYADDNFANMVDFPIKVNETTTFKIASFSNLCGKRTPTDNRSATVTITTPPTKGLILKAYPQRICVGTNAKVYFKATGNFNNDNDFKVELTSYQSSVPIVLGTGKTSPIDIKIPENLPIEDNNFYFIKVVASNPSLKTDGARIYINKKPSVKISVRDDISNSILTNKEIQFYLDEYEGLSSSNILTFSDGSTYSGDKRIYKSFSETTTFSLVSIKNECGINTDVKKSFTIKVYPFKTTVDRHYRSTNCANKLLLYPYTVEGNMPVGTIFNLQIASKKDSIFKNVVTETTDNPIRFKLPSNTSDGQYFIRLVSNDKYYSSWQYLILDKSPSIELTGKDGLSQVTIDGGNATDLVYQLKSGSEGFTNTVDNYNQSYPFTVTKNNFIQKIYPTKTTTYTLKLSANGLCGYGTVAGSVKVVVNPSVKLNSLDSYTLCPEKDILLNYSTFGEFADDNIFKFSLVDDKSNKIEIGQINKLQGTLKLKMPKTFASSTYKMEVSSTNPVTSKELVSYLGVSNLPDVTLSGNTIINQGQITYINLINNVGIANSNSNLKFTLSDNIERTINGGDKKSSIFVNPNQTTTYTLKSASNICGIGKISGSATVIVNPASDKIINTGLQNNASYLCLGATQELLFTYQGSFSANNKFSVQISDKNGDNYKSIASEGNSSPLKFKVPEDLPIGDNYRIRVVASDVNVSSASNIYPLTVNTLSTAELDSTTYLFKEGKPVNMKINLTGTPPWYVKFGSDELLTAYSQAIYSSPYVRTIIPTMPTSYKIFAVSDGYCLGKVLGTGIVRIELITANEDPKDLNITLFPNPTPNFVTIRSDNFKNTRLKIVDSLGKDILEQDLVKSETVLDFSGFTTGLYFLQFNRDNKRVVYKIQKL